MVPPLSMRSRSLTEFFLGLSITILRQPPLLQVSDTVESISSSVLGMSSFDENCLSFLKACMNCLLSTIRSSLKSLYFCAPITAKADWKPVLPPTLTPPTLPPELPNELFPMVPIQKEPPLCSVSWSRSLCLNFSSTSSLSTWISSIWLSHCFSS